MAEFSPERAYERVRPSTLTQERWFRHKLADVTRFEVVDYAQLESGGGSGGSLVLGILRIEGAGDYFVPVVTMEADGSEDFGFASDDPSSSEADCPKVYGVIEGGAGRNDTIIYDGAFHPNYINIVLDLIESDVTVPAARGQFRFRKIGSNRTERGWAVSEVGYAYTNSVVIAERRSAFKTFRLMTPGVNPDVEVGVALATMTDFRETARMQGEVSYVDDQGVEYSVGVQTEEVPNIGDAWELVGASLERAIEPIMAGSGAEGVECLASEGILSSDTSWQLGATVGRLHKALASIDAPGFRIRNANVHDIDIWRRNARSRARRALADIRYSLDCGSLVGDMDVEHGAKCVLAAREAILGAVEGISLGPAIDPSDVGVMMRCHGDLHLGQVLVGRDGSYAILDFEGEPLASVEERRALMSPARDVAGMLRSYSYAANAALASARRSYAGESLSKLERLIGEWEDRAREAFLAGYCNEAGSVSVSLLPKNHSARDALVSYFELEKALYEVSYELNNRPDWAGIPLRGVRRIVKNLGGGH